MRLLHVSRLQLKTFFGSEIPKYAILSHTWTEDEFLFKDLEAGLARQSQNPKRGLSKVLQTCKIAQKFGLKWVWVDTCCIDKSSSSELSEAINSMFRWYQRSTICLVFLEDVALESDGSFTNFETSRWFTRGWTLQELIAPHRLLFFDGGWNFLASSNHISPRLASITGVAERFFKQCYLNFVTNEFGPLLCDCDRFDLGIQSELRKESVATRMHWAAKRRTTREEDTAYCLMGLFDINMPLLYGEGGVNAFYRLQKEIINSVDDQSILLWHAPIQYEQEIDPPLLAKHPSWFSHGGLVQKNHSLGHMRSINMSPSGLELEVLLVPYEPVFRKGLYLPLKSEKRHHLAVLACNIDGDVLKRPAFFLSPEDDAQDSLVRPYYRAHRYLSVMLHFDAKAQLIYEGGVWDPARSQPRRRGPTTFWPRSVIVELSMFRKQKILLRPYEKDVPIGRPPPQQELQVSLRVKGQGHGSYRCRMAHPPLSADMVLTKDGSNLSFHELGDGVLFSLEGILFFWRDDPPSGFFVLWGHSDLLDRDNSSPEVSWVESWESLTGLKEFDTKTIEEIWAFERLKDLITKRCNKISRPWTSPTQGLDLDVQVKTSIETVSFLDIPARILTVEIE
ncbi:hypothetical protein ACJZ2D_013990 [Fusarium nematophilum]